MKKNQTRSIDCSQEINDGNENLEDYNPTKKSVSFDNTIADTEVNKKIKSYSHWIFHKRKKKQHLTCFLCLQPWQDPLVKQWKP